MVSISRGLRYIELAATILIGADDVPHDDHNDEEEEDNGDNNPRKKAKTKTWIQRQDIAAVVVVSTLDGLHRIRGLKYENSRCAESKSIQLDVTWFKAILQVRWRTKERGDWSEQGIVKPTSEPYWIATKQPFWKRKPAGTNAEDGQTQTQTSVSHDLNRVKRKFLSRNDR